MLRPRIIACLLIHDGGLVKTQRFTDPKYVGDPINAVKIFNEKQVDELMVVDIDATVRGNSPDYTLIKNLAAECNMPLCYGGGIRTVEAVDEIIGLGVEKVAMSSAIVNAPEIVAKAAEIVGSQSIVAVMDVKKRRLRGKYDVYTHNGTQRTGLSPTEFAARAEETGAGEVIVNSIDRDGVMGGYDISLGRSVRDAIGLPLTILGGAGSLDDISALISEFEIIGAAAGSLFVFKGPYRAVLINYPRPEERDDLIRRASPDRA